MAENKKPKKHRHKRHYTVMIISGDSDGGSGSFHLGHVATQVLAFSLFAVLVAVICFIVHSAITVSSVKNNNAIQAAKIQELETANASLEASNSELQSEVSQLSQALNQKVEVEAKTEAEAAEQSLPTLLPLSGTASMENTYDDPNSTERELPELEKDEDGNEIERDTTGLDPILVFKAEEGSTIISAGSGTVTSVTGDIKYGTCVTIDHGNGYISIYRNEGDSLVHEGDEVVRGATLFVVGSKNTTLGFQIKKDDSFVDAEGVIEING
ncbi:MAG: M23 family metallopeptidase [Butyrivibrio sp.]|nr:M23 family metallopeptidase [Butyrivibrio sp.]